MSANTIFRLKRKVERIQPNPIQYPLPNSLRNVTLRDYQLVGMNWMIDLYDHGWSGILSDEMGLGKTLQSISFLCYLHEARNVNGPFLIICPLSVVDTWVLEMESHTEMKVSHQTKWNCIKKKN